VLEIAAADLNENIEDHLIMGSPESIVEAPETPKPRKRGRFVIERSPLKRGKTGFTSSQ
jgi:hypothetical protein